MGCQASGYLSWDCYPRVELGVIVFGDSHHYLLAFGRVKVSNDLWNGLE